MVKSKNVTLRYDIIFIAGSCLFTFCKQKEKRKEFDSEEDVKAFEDTDQ